MPVALYTSHGILFRYRRRAQQARHPESPPFFGTFRRRNRAKASAFAAIGVETPSRAERRRLRRITGRCSAAPLSASTRATDGDGRVAGSLPPLLVKASRCAGATPRQHGSTRKEITSDKKEKQMKNASAYSPGPASAEIQKNGD